MKTSKLLLLSLIVSYGKSLYSQTPSTDPHWQIVWQDNFEDNMIDQSKWTVIDWAHGNEQTLYLSENVSESGGNLLIEMNNNPVECYNGHPPTVWGGRYPCETGVTYNQNSGWIESKAQYDQKYGFFEAKVKMPH